MKKKILLGTTAIIAASIVSAGVAKAEDPISVGVGGYFMAAMGMISQDNSDGELADSNASHSLGHDVELTVSGSTTLDNGITAGISAQIEGNGAAANSAAMDERHIFFSGSFGQIQVGNIESARQQMTNFAPGGSGVGFGINSAVFVFGNMGSIGNIRTYNDGIGDEDNMKLVYFSPTFNGFRFGVSYSPEDNQAGQYGGNAGDAVSGLQNNTAVGASFSQGFGDFNLSVMGGFETYVLERCNAAANTQTCNDSVDSTQFGGTISFGDFAIGGGYLETEQITLAASGAGRDRTDFDLGISWGSGPLSLGIQYAQAELENADDTTDEMDLIEVNATYVLGPGISVGASLASGEFDDETAGAALDNSYTTFKMGTALNF